MGVHPVHAALSTLYVQKLITLKACQIVRQSGFCRTDLEDVQQELTARVLRAAPLFDPGRGSVHTFVDRVVGAATATILRDRRRLKRAADRQILSLERHTAGHSNYTPIPLRDVISGADQDRRRGTNVSGEEPRELTQNVARLLAALPPDVRHIATRVAETSEAAVARELRISRRQVRKALAAAREHLEAAGFSEF
jgi:RNA polymerase sigma factor (sigma-70 family)